MGRVHNNRVVDCEDRSGNPIQVTYDFIRCAKCNENIDEHIMILAEEEGLDDNVKMNW